MTQLISDTAKLLIPCLALLALMATAPILASQILI